MTRQRENAAAPARPDFFPGDPVKHIIGADEEQSARVHAPLPKRTRGKNKPTARSIQRSIKARIEELKPLLEEHKRLEEALKLLQDIK